MSIQKYRLGCPVWSYRDWKGELYVRNAQPHEFLSQYARVFNAVEGNTTFHALPHYSTAKKWNTNTPEHFRFCFKFPRFVSHIKMLVGVEKYVDMFFNRLKPVYAKLGPFFLQLPPDFSRQSLPVLRKFLQKLPPDFAYAVEVRHPDFFHHDEVEKEFNAILAERNIDRVICDTRHLDLGSHDEPEPFQLPLKDQNGSCSFVTTGRNPFVRIFINPDFGGIANILHEWARCVSTWISEGKIPYVFLHSTSDYHSPHLARQFHQILRNYDPGVGRMPPWPGESENKTRIQLELF
ncbi:MAG: DUF72 domain-containing protein [Calditrichaeota bacterium]|nr:MAG: DUF72 domain-containing protein [Calditrichota bacterium]